MNWKQVLGAMMALIAPFGGQSQDIEWATDPWEVRFEPALYAPDAFVQQAFRSSPEWTVSAPAQAGWMVEADDQGMFPRRMYGPGVTMATGTTTEQAAEAWEWAFQSYGWNEAQLGPIHVAKGPKHVRAFAHQMLEGKPVLGTKLQAKFRGSSW